MLIEIAYLGKNKKAILIYVVIKFLGNQPLQVKIHCLGLMTLAVTKGKPWALRATEQALKHTALCIHMCIFTPVHTHYIMYTMRAYAVSSVMSGSLQPIWTAACQAPLSMELSRQECWSG